MSSSIHSKRGFTLVELSVTLIIVFLTGLFVYPVFARRPQDTQKVELGNQKQVALAFLMYTQDYDEHFPPAVTYTGLSNTSATHSGARERFTQSWGPNRRLSDGRVVSGILAPYTKNDQLYLDPNNPTEDKNRILELMYNDLLVYQTFSVVASPSSTILITSAENRLANVGHALTPDSGPFAAVFNKKGGCDAGAGASVRSARLRNNGGTYFGFADGHVKWFKGGPDDPIFFPPRSSNSKSYIDARTKKPIGPAPGGKMEFHGLTYAGTFHIH